MYSASQNYNSLSTSPLLPLVGQPSSPRHRAGWTVVIGLVGILIAALLLIYTRGIDAVMNLFGVGASGIYEISITTTEDWLGINTDKTQLIGGANLEGVNVFASFSSVPQDIDPSAQGLGLVIPIYSSPSDPPQEIYNIHQYTSPIVDLGYPAPYLSAIEVADYNPAGGQINYFYRTADSVETIGATAFMPLDPSVAGNVQSNVSVRTAVIDQPVKRYAQIKFELLNNTSANRSAVYSVNFQYKKSAEVTDLSQLNLGSGQVTEQNITVKYETTNAPINADIDVVSADLNDALVYSAQGVDLSGRLNYSFVTALAPGVYALTISAPSSLQTKIIPFLAGGTNNISLDAGSFTQSTGQLVNDLNGDGVVNSIDILMQYKQNALQ